ncbi:MAG: hypothetical protein EBY69_02775, partial [Burkholderiaceae bacterium]|nr:hypothetical protein [Burkholderiaceae bacterium]
MRGDTGGGGPQNPGHGSRQRDQCAQVLGKKTVGRGQRLQDFQVVQARAHGQRAVHGLGLQGGVEVHPLADELGRLVLANQQTHRMGDAREVALGAECLHQRWGELHIAAAR